LAVGFKNGQISILKTESLEEVGSALQTSEGNEIIAISWKQLAIQH
jgi:hypothetical protein